MLITRYAEPTPDVIARPVLLICRADYGTKNLSVTGSAIDSHEK